MSSETQKGFRRLVHEHQTPKALTIVNKNGSPKTPQRGESLDLECALWTPCATQFTFDLFYCSRQFVELI